MQKMPFTWHDHTDIDASTNLCSQVKGNVAQSAQIFEESSGHGNGGGVFLNSSLPPNQMAPAHQETSILH